MSSWTSWRGSLAVTFTSRIFGFVSLVVLGVVGYLLLHEQQVLEKELQNRGLLTATHLAEQSLDPILRELEQVITAQEDERKRIARELHDETSQALTSLMVGLKVLEQRSELAEMRESLADLRALTGKTLDAVHDLALQLRPSVLDDLGLVPAVERIVGEFRRTHGIQVAFETNLRAERRLPTSLETALYRITQEALTNVARHAGAHSVSLLLEARRGSVTLIVEDDGRGFDVASWMSGTRDERSLGVFGMRERATLLGGTLTIESTPGNGTTVFVEVPLPSPLTSASPPPRGYPGEREGEGSSGQINEHAQADPDPAGG